MAVDVGKFLLEKLHEFLLLLQNLWTCLLKKFDEVFPPETRAEKIKHWLQIGAPVGLAAVLLLLCVCCCCRGWLSSCCGSWLRCCRRCFCCCCGRGGKMMKAPGRGFLMLRDDFESDPRSYFTDLRSNRECLIGLHGSLADRKKESSADLEVGRQKLMEGRRGKMMKAPGRGYLMLRDDFESDPRSYFTDLRSNRY